MIISRPPRIQMNTQHKFGGKTAALRLASPTGSRNAPSCFINHGKQNNGKRQQC